MARVKLLQLITLSELGGAQVVLYHLVSGLDRGKYNITVACAPGGELVAWLRALDGVRVVEIPALKRELSLVSDPAAFFALYRLMRRERFDIVHCHSSKAGILGRLAARLAGVPAIIFTVHGWGINDYQSRGKRLLFTAAERLAGRLCSRVVCVSRADLERGRRERLAPPDKLALIYNGVPAPRAAAGERGSADPAAARINVDVDFAAASGKCDHPEQLVVTPLDLGSGPFACPVADEVVRVSRTPPPGPPGIETYRAFDECARRTVNASVQPEGTGSCRNGDRNTALRRELGLDGSHLLVGMVCRLRAPKEPLFFLAVARTLLNGGLDLSRAGRIERTDDACKMPHSGLDMRPAVHTGQAGDSLLLNLGESLASRLRFVLIGDGPLRPECERYIRENGLAGKVFLTGARADAAALVTGLDVFVLFSRWEGLPLTIIEAMHAGRPVVASAVGGVPELVQPGVTGYLAPPGDLPVAVERLSALLADNDLRCRMGEAGRRLAAKRFSVARMVREYQALYDAVLTRLITGNAFQNVYQKGSQ